MSDLKMTNQSVMKEYPNGIRVWYLNGKLHRTDGPAAEYTDGTREWFMNGLLHRTDGPAIEYADGTCEWYLNDKQYTYEVWRKLTFKNEAQIQQVEDDAQSEFIAEALEVVMPVLQKAIREAFIAGAEWWTECELKDNFYEAANEYTIRVTRGKE